MDGGCEEGEGKKDQKSLVLKASHCLLVAPGVKLPMSDVRGELGFVVRRQLLPAESLLDIDRC